MTDRFGSLSAERVSRLRRMRAVIGIGFKKSLKRFDLTRTMGMPRPCSVTYRYAGLELHRRQSAWRGRRSDSRSTDGN